MIKTFFTRLFSSPQGIFAFIFGLIAIVLISLSIFSPESLPDFLQNSDTP